MSLSTQIWERFCNCIKVQWVSLLKLENIVSFPWDPLDVSLHPMGSLGTPRVPPSTPFDPKIPPLIRLDDINCLKNHQSTYHFFRGLIKYGCWPHGTPYTSALTSWDPQDVPFDPKIKSDYQGTNWSLRLYHSLPYALFQSISFCPIHLADLSWPIGPVKNNRIVPRPSLI